MTSQQADICGAVDHSTGIERKCYKKPHIKLQVVKPGDTAKSLKLRWVPHVFETRYPYRTKEQ